jgi:hypothetical protein
LRNPRCKGYPRFFSTIYYYHLLKKIYMDCCCCSSRSYLLSKKKGGWGARCCCSCRQYCCCCCCSHSRHYSPTFCPPSFVFTPPVCLCSHLFTFTPPAPLRSYSPALVHIRGCSCCCCWCPRCSPPLSFVFAAVAAAAVVRSPSFALARFCSCSLHLCLQL